MVTMSLGVQRCEKVAAMSMENCAVRGVLICGKVMILVRFPETMTTVLTNPETIQENFSKIKIADDINCCLNLECTGWS